MAGESKQLCREMKRDLMRVYRKECENYGGILQTEVFERTVRHPAPRFYVHAKSALRYISPMMRGDRRDIDRMKPLRRQMYEALFDVVMTLAQKERFWGMPPYTILRQAVMEPAPRFYIDATRMGQIFQEQQAKDNTRRREMERKYQRN